MKCFFDKQPESMDVILMCLYKRMYPKWNYSARLDYPDKEAQRSEMDLCEEYEDSDDHME